jgi:MFS family permease
MRQRGAVFECGPVRCACGYRPPLVPGAMRRRVRLSLRIIQHTFQPLAVRSVRVYIGGQAISNIGSLMQATAQSWLVWELTHSPAALGVVGMLSNLPFLVLGSLGGVIADRGNRRTLLIGTQLAAMACACALALLVQTHTVTIGAVYALALTLGIISAIEAPAHQAFLGDVAGVGDVQRAVMLNSITVQTSRMIGPALAGWLIGMLNPAPVFWLNGVSFLAVVAGVWTIQSTQAPPEDEPRHPWRDMQEGFVTLWRHPRFRDITVLCILNSTLAWSCSRLLPAMAVEALHGDARTLGALLTAAGAGALVGAVVLTPLAHRIHRPGVVLCSAIMWRGLWFVVFGWSARLPVSLVALFCETLAFPVVSATACGYFQTASAPGARARVLSAWMTATIGLAPLSDLALGYSAEHLGAPRVIGWSGMLLLCLPVLYLWHRQGLVAWSTRGVSPEGGLATPAPKRPAAHRIPVGENDAGRRLGAYPTV